MTEKEKMLSGNLYKLEGEELIADRIRMRKLVEKFNRSSYDEEKLRVSILKELFAKTGENICVEPPFYCDYGYNISVGDDFYANFDCVILDVCRVEIGKNVFLGPRVNIYTAGHPIDAKTRAEKLEFGKPVKIGDDVWIGGNSVINPGVEIGNNVVIGSGSVVVKNIPDGVVAAGNPCRVIRKIEDK
ncbi:MAG: sugar O-acetyltransferase [Chitinispirillales bacterium]|jgi:maltose O-acetyltransferase|nr:sugar O-acetyltransferase [Chitinispirillales bacterium]